MRITALSPTTTLRTMEYTHRHPIPIPINISAKATPLVSGALQAGGTYQPTKRGRSQPPPVLRTRPMTLRQKVFHPGAMCPPLSPRRRIPPVNLPQVNPLLTLRVPSRLGSSFLVAALLLAPRSEVAPP